MSDRKGKIQTVLGLVEPSVIGNTMCHEHLFMNGEALRFPALHEPDIVRKLPFEMKNIGLIRQYYNSNDENLLLNDYSAIEDEMNEYKKYNGSCIVDCTIVGLEPRVELLKQISQSSGVHILAGSGYYIDCAHSPEFKSSVTMEQKVEFITNEIVTGVGDTGIKCGHIGEIGCSYPLTEFERSSLRAAALVQRELGAPLVVHPGRDPKSAEEITRVVAEAGADLTKLIMSHLDRTYSTEEQLLEVSELGTLLAYDMFGHDVSWYPVNPDFDNLSDGQRIEFVRFLLKQGFEDRILIAQDIWSKHRLTKYGGHGYSHVLTNIVPRMKMRGVTDSQIDKMLIHNPRRWMTFNK